MRRTGRKEDAEREFALQQQAAERMGGQAATERRSDRFHNRQAAFVAPALSLDAWLAPPDLPDCAASLTPSLHRAYPFEEVPPSASRITWVHTAGKSPEKYLPETTGAGCAFLDYDNDGWMDIYLVNSGKCDFYNPNPPLRNALYRNNRDGTFTDVTEKAGLPLEGTGKALQWATTTATASPTST